MLDGTGHLLKIANLQAFGTSILKQKSARENQQFTAEMPRDHPERLPTFRGAIAWLALSVALLLAIAGCDPVLIAELALFASAAVLPLPKILAAYLAGLGVLLAVLLGGGDPWPIRCSIELGGAAVLGSAARRFLLGVEWELACRKLLGKLVETDATATPDIPIARTIAELRSLARADAAIVLRQIDEVTAEAIAALPETALPDKLTTPKIFAEALAQNCCLYYTDYPASPDAVRVLVAKGTQSLAVLPLQDAGSLRGAVVLIWHRRTEISAHLKGLSQSLIGGLRTLLRFSDTAFHFEKLQARYSAILETIPQGVVFADESGEHGWVNQAGAVQLDLSPGAVEPVSIALAMGKLRTFAENAGAIAQQAAEFFSQPMAEIRDWVWICRGEALATGEREQPDAGADTRRVLSISSTPTRVRDVPGRLWLLDDITDKYFSRQALVDRTAQLEAVNQELEAFSHSVAHDLRAPLAVIDAFSQLLFRDYGDKLDEEGLEDLQSIRTAAERMGQLINDLLQFARVTRSEMKREPVDLSALVAAIARNLQKAQPHRQVEFAIAANVVAKADAHLMQIVLENLLNNAWKYTSKHAIARVEFGVLPDSPDSGAAASPQGLSRGHRPYTYFVRDDGAGFDMAHAEKLFKTFQRLHRNADFEGTGVGLATVQRIIHRHGGQIWAEAALERGATFYFTL